MNLWTQLNLRLALSKIVRLQYDFHFLSLIIYYTVNGWPNGYAFILSFLAPLWVVCMLSRYLASQTNAESKLCRYIRCLRPYKWGSRQCYCCRSLGNHLCLRCCQCIWMGWAFVQSSIQVLMFQRNSNKCGNCVLHGYGFGEHCFQSYRTANGYSTSLIISVRMSFKCHFVDIVQ